ncbi:MAG TPA: 16S rRNA (cytosine(1402)-N(4))-methyltransferase RsmH [Gemmatimonadota bacterium]|nr:16S rRNA (cytosine(1402)-N(4))-methyltransferase RsmH [Gemmatimonadota bacterium]
MDGSARYHEPALLSETLAALAPFSGGIYLDGTLGDGGHAEAILDAAEPDGRLVGLDRDPEAIERAGRRLARFGDRVELHQMNFSELDRVPATAGTRFDGALLDLGVSSRQIDEMARGFSYRQDAPLDMRMGPRGEPARSLLTRADIDTLARIFRDYGEERHARSIARAIVRERERAPLESTGRLREIVESAVPSSGHPLKSVARVFQALRIAVNDELASLQEGLPRIFARIVVGGRMAVISYHSLEDRIVKRFFREMVLECVCPPDFPVCRCDKVAEAALLTRRSIEPGAEEIASNPRARSARLRAAERVRAAARGLQPERRP